MLPVAIGGSPMRYFALASGFEVFYFKKSELFSEERLVCGSDHLPVPNF